MDLKSSRQDHLIEFLQLLYFFKLLVDIYPFMGSLIPLFWTFDDVYPGFQSQSEQPYLQ